MILIDYGEPEFKTRPAAAGTEIFDPFRRKWVVLNPEEWVRQNLLAALVNKVGYPASLVAVERGLKVGELNRRFDAIIFRRDGSPWMLIECKADTESLNDGVVSQLLAYQSSLSAAYMLITNGRFTRGWRIVANKAEELDALPEWET